MHDVLHTPRRAAHYAQAHRLVCTSRTSTDHCFVIYFAALWKFSQVGMAASSQIRRDPREWAVFRFNPHVEADPEPYKSLLLERQRIQDMEDRIHLRKMTGGRKRKRVIVHAKKEHDMRKENFGFKEIVNRAGCILAEAVAAECTKQEFHRNFRMSDYLFDRIHKDITDPKWGCTRFLKRPDAVGHFGPSPVQKMYSVIHMHLGPALSP